MMLTEIKNPNWWRNCTSLEKRLLLLSAFSYIALIPFVSALELILLKNQRIEELKTTLTNHNALALTGSNKAATQYKLINDTSNSNEICISAECNATASAVLSTMNPKVNPCENFYQFTCGNFIKKTQIPDDTTGVNSFIEITNKLQEQLKAIMTEERPKTEPKALRMPNAFYKACMNEALIESLGTKPFQQISDALGGWPVVVGKSWDCNDTWTWQETIKKFRYLGFSTNYIFEFSVLADSKNNTRNIIILSTPSTGLSEKYLIKGFNSTQVSAYYNYMVDLAVMFGAKRENALKELKESLEFHIKLANISWLSQNSSDMNYYYNLRTIKKIQVTYPYVQWLDYINALLPDNITVDENEIINVEVPRFFEDLGKLLNRTDKRVIANYMMWRIHDYSISFLTKEFRDREFKYIAALTGQQQQKARWKQCIDSVLQSLQISVGALYVRKHFDPVSKANAVEMVNNIRKVFNQMLEVKWMDKKTQLKAKKKLQLMASSIGYPDEMLDNDKLEKYYNKLEMHPDKYFESYLNLNVFETDYSFSQLREPVNKTDWRRNAYPAVVNAFYSPDDNIINFPAGILQDRFFNSQRPKYMNYGAIGFFIGHEITHGFDVTGRQYDANGNLVDWWEPKTQKAYLKNAKCIADQYGGYTDKQTALSLNGNNTKKENIADNGGVKAAYMAYNKWVEENGKEPRLPGLNYSPQQMFWISFSQPWCGIYRTEYLKHFITTDSHSTDEFRVLGPLRNNKDFAKDFQCPVGAAMNPVHKCEVW